ncbi:MAG: hypothetical protein ABR576_13395 [Thermoanaerobaculia bacterium]
MTDEKDAAPARPADAGMSEEEKKEMFDQMEEFEGPQRREIRGDDAEPPRDPGVAHS